MVRQGQHFDPDRWAADGFADRADSLSWCDRVCGIACVAMVLDHADVAHPGRAGLLHQARRADGYTSAGWLHRGLVDLLSRYGVAAEPVAVPPPDLGGP